MMIRRKPKEEDMFTVRLFGNGSASQINEPLDGFPGQQAGLLLCYLFLNRSQPQSRERLAAVFWENLPAATARKYLPHAPWPLKDALEPGGATPGAPASARPPWPPRMRFPGTGWEGASSSP